MELPSEPSVSYRPLWGRKFLRGKKTEIITVIVKRQVQNISHTSTCRRMLCFAVIRAEKLLFRSRFSRQRSPSGKHDERTVLWRTAIGETSRRPAGFVEG